MAGIVQVVGIFVAVAMTMVVGIKYMLTSPEGKAQYKKTAILYLLGALFIFATSQIIGLIDNFMDSMALK